MSSSARSRAGRSWAWRRGPGRSGSPPGSSSTSARAARRWHPTSRPRWPARRRPTAGSWSVSVGTSRPLGAPRTAAGGSWPARTARPRLTRRARSSRSSRARWRPPARRSGVGGPPMARTGITSIDPRTGAPVEGPWRTVTVVADSCVAANAAATEAIVLSERGLARAGGGRPGGPSGRSGGARSCASVVSAENRCPPSKDRLMFDQVLWFSTRGAGIVSLLLSTTVVCLGFATVARWQARGLAAVPDRRTPPVDRAPVGRVRHHPRRHRDPRSVHLARRPGRRRATRLVLSTGGGRPRGDLGGPACRRHHHQPGP